jgi:hypothetical protein
MGQSPFDTAQDGTTDPRYTPMARLAQAPTPAVAVYSKIAYIEAIVTAKRAGKLVGRRARQARLHAREGRHCRCRTRRADKSFRSTMATAMLVAAATRREHWPGELDLTMVALVWLV